MFELTTLDTSETARLARVYFKKHGFRVKVERAAWPDAPYRTSLTCERRGQLILVECQGALRYHGALRGLHDYLYRERRSAELFIAVGTTYESSISAAALGEMDRDGVGLLLVGERGTVTVSKRACNWAYYVAPAPTLRFGGLRPRVEACFTKYNRTNQVDGLRDLSDLVEGETRRLARLALRRGCFGAKRPNIDNMDWQTLINLLASPNATIPAIKPVIGDPLKLDLHSFRGGRNLVDHPVRTRKAEEARARQFQDRMVLGARLVADLDSIRRSLAAQ